MHTIPRRQALRQLGLITAGLAAACTPLRVLVSAYPQAFDDDGGLMDRVIRAFVTAVIPGAPADDPDLVRAHTDPAYPFAQYAGFFAADLSRRAVRRLPADVRSAVPPQVQEGGAGRPPEPHVRRGPGRRVRLLRDGIAAGAVARVRPGGRAGPTPLASGARPTGARSVLRRRGAHAARVPDPARRGAEDGARLRPAHEEPRLLGGPRPVCGARLPGEWVLCDGMRLRSEAVAVPQLPAAGGRGRRRDRDGPRGGVDRVPAGYAARPRPAAGRCSLPLPGAVPPPHRRARLCALRRPGRRARRGDGGQREPAAPLAGPAAVLERARRTEHRLQRQREGSGAAPRFVP